MITNIYTEKDFYLQQPMCRRIFILLKLQNDSHGLKSYLDIPCKISLN